MQSLEVFKISIKKWVFVIPFDLKRERSAREHFHMINLMRNGLFFFTINYLLDFEVMLLPTKGIRKLSAQTLGHLPFSTPASHKLLNGDLNCQQSFFKFSNSLSHVVTKNRLCMMQNLYLESLLLQLTEHEAMPV